MRSRRVPRSTEPAAGNAPKFLRWALAFLFFCTGGAKLIGLPTMQQTFEHFVFPEHFVLVIGVLEIAGAIGLLLPGLVFKAALGLCGIMIGAIVTHVAYDPIHLAFRALIVLVLLTGIAWIYRPVATSKRAQVTNPMLPSSPRDDDKRGSG